MFPPEISGYETSHWRVSVYFLTSPEVSESEGWLPLCAAPIWKATAASDGGPGAGVGVGEGVGLLVAARATVGTTRSRQTAIRTPRSGERRPTFMAFPTR